MKFIHIGKCGGTTIKKYFNLDEYHLNLNYSNNEYYVIWIRNPLNRFVSAFNFSFSLINLEINNLDINNLSLDNCLSPGRIANKILRNNNFIFSERYDYLINYFNNPNNLAESLTSDDINQKKLAFELMNSRLEHINNGIGYYFYNGDFIDKNYYKIIFVGSIENMNDDILRLGSLLNIETNTIFKVRENKYEQNKFLSTKAIENLLDFYKDTDYKALEKLLQYNFISNELFDSYKTYNNS